MPVDPGDDLVLAEGEVCVGLVLLDGVVCLVHNDPICFRQLCIVVYKYVTNLILLQSKIKPAGCSVLTGVGGVK